MVRITTPHGNIVLRIEQDHWKQVLLLNAINRNVRKRLDKALTDTVEESGKHLEETLVHTISTGENVDNNKGYPLLYRFNLVTSVRKQHGYEVNRKTHRKTTYKTSVRLATPRPYLRALEYGTRPYKPPLKPLIAWAFVKFGNLAIAENVARKIQRKIMTHGIKPRAYIRNSMFLTRKEMKHIFARNMQKRR